MFDSMECTNKTLKQNPVVFSLVRPLRVSRNCRGQIELFTSILAVATIFVVGYSLILIDTGLSAYYKEKLQFVAQQGASFAADYKKKDVNVATQRLVSSLCQQMNLQASNLKVATKSGQAASCSVSASFPIIQGSVLPATISLSDVESSSGGSGASSIIKLAIIGNGNTFYNPGGSVSGSVLGNGNKVVTTASASGPDPGNGSEIGNGNTNTGSGSVIGNGNNNSGSGNTLGNGNMNSGSGNVTGNTNTNSGSGNVTGNGNASSSPMNVVGNRNSVN